jgi:hypothetical protein
VGGCQFVDINLCKITKRKIIEIIPPCTDGKSELVTFTGSLKTHPCYVHINPTSKEYSHENTKIWNSKKCYLVFTEVEVAQKALIKYVLPRKIQAQSELCDLKREEFMEAVDKTSAIENELKKNTEDFDKKCNALKKKSV